MLNCQVEQAVGSSQDLLPKRLVSLLLIITRTESRSFALPMRIPVHALGGTLFVKDRHVVSFFFVSSEGGLEASCAD
jgi:hypothetical protein